MKFFSDHTKIAWALGLLTGCSPGGCAGDVSTATTELTSATVEVPYDSPPPPIVVQAAPLPPVVVVTAAPEPADTAESTPPDEPAVSPTSSGPGFSVIYRDYGQNPMSVPPPAPPASPSRAPQNPPQQSQAQTEPTEEQQQSVPPPDEGAPPIDVVVAPDGRRADYNEPKRPAPRVPTPSNAPIYDPPAAPKGGAGLPLRANH